MNTEEKQLGNGTRTTLGVGTKGFLVLQKRLG